MNLCQYGVILQIILYVCDISYCGSVFEKTVFIGLDVSICAFKCINKNSQMTNVCYLFWLPSYVDVIGYK